MDPFTIPTVIAFALLIALCAAIRFSLIFERFPVFADKYDIERKLMELADDVIPAFTRLQEMEEERKRNPNSHTEDAIKHQRLEVRKVGKPFRIAKRWARLFLYNSSGEWKAYVLGAPQFAERRRS